MGTKFKDIIENSTFISTLTNSVLSIKLPKRYLKILNNGKMSFSYHSQSISGVSGGTSVFAIETLEENLDLDCEVDTYVHS